MLNWNPTGPETLAINGFYSNGMISTVEAYNAGIIEGRNRAMNDYNSKKAGYTDQTIATGLRSEHSPSPFYMTFNELSRIDAIVYCSGPAYDSYAPDLFEYRIPQYGNTLTVYDSGEGIHSTGNHYVTITARQYHALD